MNKYSMNKCNIDIKTVNINKNRIRQWDESDAVSG